MKVLLIYPNCEGYGRVPLSLSILSACLKDHGHETKLFDLTFMVSKNIDNEMREKIGTAKKVDTQKFWGEVGNVDIGSAMKDMVLDFKPDLVGITLIQNNYWFGMDLLQEIRGISGALIIAGGAFASVAPEILLKSNLVDVVVLGEGEEAFVELVEKIETYKDFSLTPNLAFLKNGRLECNFLREYTNLNKVPFQDLSIFDQRHFMKPFDGEMRRSGYFELTRGCPFSCTYCANYFLNEKLYCNEKRHIRFKDAEYCVREIKELNKKYKFEMIFFADENMLMLPMDKLKKLAKLWKEEVGIPFYVTTRVETANDENIGILKDMGCATVAFGIECGNEEFRRKILKRNNTNEQIIKAFKLCRKHGIRTTANNMFGFPYETEELIFDTIRLSIEANPDSFSLSIFAPYLGTQLHEVCVREGYIKDGIPPRISMIDETILEMPQIKKERILDLYINFVRYVSGEMKIPDKFMKDTIGSKGN